MFASAGEMQFVRVFLDFNPSEEDALRKTFLPAKRGEVLAVSWKDSSFAWLWVSRVEFGMDINQQKEGFVPSSHCRPVQFTCLEAVLRSSSTVSVTENVDNSELFFFDALNLDDENACKDAPALSPELESICWPLSVEQFVSTVWRKRVFCVLGSVDRIEQSRLAEDFPNVPDKLIEQSDSPVVFMKTLQGNM